MRVTGTILFLCFLTGTLAASAVKKNGTESEAELEVTTEETEDATTEEIGDETTEENNTTPSFEDNPSPEYSPSQLQRCTDLTGIFMDGVFEGIEVKYDLAKILEEHGGPPGKVNATWAEKEDAPVETADLEKRPLPDADQKYWLYKYGDTDGESYIRIEHAVKRLSRTTKAFTEIRGVMHFTPDDFCGFSRNADYTVDDRGFSFEVSREYCSIQSNLACYPPGECDTEEDGTVACRAGGSYELLASLVGGGK